MSRPPSPINTSPVDDSVPAPATAPSSTSNIPPLTSSSPLVTLSVPPPPLSSSATSFSPRSRASADAAARTIQRILVRELDPISLRPVRRRFVLRRGAAAVVYDAGTLHAYLAETAKGAGGRNWGGLGGLGGLGGGDWGGPGTNYMGGPGTNYVGGGDHWGEANTRTNVPSLHTLPISSSYKKSVGPLDPVTRTPFTTRELARLRRIVEGRRGGGGGAKVLEERERGLGCPVQPERMEREGGITTTARRIFSALEMLGSIELSSGSDDSASAGAGNGVGGASGRRGSGGGANNVGGSGDGTSGDRTSGVGIQTGAGVGVGMQVGMQAGVGMGAGVGVEEVGTWSPRPIEHPQSLAATTYDAAVCVCCCPCICFLGVVECVDILVWNYPSSMANGMVVV